MLVVAKTQADEVRSVSLTGDEMKGFLARDKVPMEIMPSECWSWTSKKFLTERFSGRVPTTLKLARNWRTEKEIVKHLKALENLPKVPFFLYL